MDKNERKERLKTLKKEDNYLSWFSVASPIIALIATAGVFLIYNQNNNKQETNLSNKNYVKEEKKLNSVNKTQNNDNNLNLNQQNYPLKNKNKQENNLLPSSKLNQDKQSLNIIQEKITTVAKKRNLPLEKLSFSLMDLSGYSCPLINGKQAFCYSNYQDNITRYPASMVKLFWLVIAYHQNPNPNEEFKKQLVKMIVDSDNEAASIIVDNITKTKSNKEKLPTNEFKQLQNKREYLNKWFNSFNYQNINITQKTFPIPYLEMDMPEGTDLQLRHPNAEEKPIRNYLTSQNIAFLLYQIYNQQFPESLQMLSLLKRDLNPTAWQNIPFNAIKGFLGEGIPDKNAQFYSKMGWTFSNRNDSAIIISPDGKTRYILVILGDDPAYYKDVEFLPIVSKIVYEEMSKLSNN
jgi:beta-lactamase class A